MARTYRLIYEADFPPSTLTPMAEALGVTVMSVTRWLRDLQEAKVIFLEETAGGRIRAAGTRLLMTPKEILAQMQMPDGQAIIQELADGSSNGD
jgi:Mn-dependent DtxR family transcriptional regulator